MIRRAPVFTPTVTLFPYATLFRSVALKRDCREAPLSQIRDILGGGKQSSLFQEDRAAQLEAARHACRGSAAANTLIDCAIEATANGLDRKSTRLNSSH